MNPRISKNSKKSVHNLIINSIKEEKQEESIVKKNRTISKDGASTSGSSRKSKKDKKEMLNLTRPMTPNLNLIRRLPCSNKNKLLIVKKNSISNQKNNSNNKDNETMKIPYSVLNKYLKTIHTEDVNKNKKSYSSSKIKISKDSNNVSINNNDYKEKKGIKAYNCRNKNSSRQKNKNLKRQNLKPFKSEAKINVVQLKVNDEINYLFNNLSDNIIKDPEIHDKIESLIKDIKGIQQTINRKTRSHFRPKKQV